MRASVGEVLNLIMAAGFAGAIVSSWEWPKHSRFFVLAIAIPGLLLTVILFVRERWWSGSERRSASPAYADTPLDADVPAGIIHRRMLNVFGWIFFLFGLIWLAGFEIAVPIFTFVYLKFQARESFWVSGLLCGAMIVLIVGVFDLILHVPWPKGALQGWLGL